MSKMRDSRGVIAAIRHDVKAGNIDRARRWAGELLEGRWSEATPAQLEQACTAIEDKLSEAGM
jgi:hypothetical protein